MKTNLIRLMAIVTLATTMSFASEAGMKRTDSKQPATTGSMQQKQTGKKTRKEKQKKSEGADQKQNSNEILGIWG